jgi:hypothetical protein
MESMFRRHTPHFSFALAIASLVFIAAGLHAQDNTRWTRKIKTPPPSSRIEVTILKADNGKPIENAAVIFHPVEGDHDKGALELKTNEDGKAIIDVIPVGDTVRLQVIARGFQTYGEEYKIDKEEMSMEIHMKRPGSQYSIYKNGPTAENGKGSGSNKNDGSSKQAAPPASDDKSSGNTDSKSESQPESKPNQSQNEAQNQ